MTSLSAAETLLLKTLKACAEAAIARAERAEADLSKAERSRWGFERELARAEADRDKMRSHISQMSDGWRDDILGRGRAEADLAAASALNTAYQQDIMRTLRAEADIEKARDVLLQIMEDAGTCGMHGTEWKPNECSVCSAYARASAFLERTASAADPFEPSTMDDESHREV